MMAQELVLVTGGSGFVGSHCVAALLAAGYAVRTTVRSPKREADVRAMMQRAGVRNDAALEFAVADLEKDAGWTEAAAGCEYVLHVASPFPLDDPKDENELIVPAVEGTLRVLRAAKAAGVKRVVFTSSIAAIAYGHGDHHPAPFTEADWTNVDGPHVPAYQKSKALAERAAWEFVEREGGGLEFVSVNPPGIFGPALGKDLSSSIEIIKQMLSGELPVALDISLSAVDVRDLAELHLLAMKSPVAAGKRYIAANSSENVTLLEAAAMLRAHLGTAARKAPKMVLPNWLARAMALVVPKLRGAVPELSRPRRVINKRAVQELGWTPRSTEEAIVASGESLIELGVISR